MEFPRVVVGLSTMVLYDVPSSKPQHRQVRWVRGIWSHLDEYFTSCKERGCLVLLAVDPLTKRQKYQHGDPGPTLEINPDKWEFSRLQDWLEAHHQREDAEGFGVCEVQSPRVGRL